MWLLNIVYVVAAVILLIAICVGSIYLARRLVQPIQTFSEAVTCISDGEMATPIDVSAIQPDFAPLGAAFSRRVSGRWIIRGLAAALLLVSLRLLWRG